MAVSENLNVSCHMTETSNFLIFSQEKQKLSIQNKDYTKMFIAALFAIAQQYKQFICPQIIAYSYNGILFANWKITVDAQYRWLSKQYAEGTKPSKDYILYESFI